MIFVFGSSFSATMVFKEQVAAGPITASNIVGVIFFSSCGASCILFFKVAQNFQQLMVKWALTELNFSSLDYKLPTKSWPLRRRLVVVTIVYLGMSTLEHLLYLATEIRKQFYDAEICKPKDVDMLRVFIFQHLPFIFKNIPIKYNHLLGFFFEYLNISYTFFWNFLDLFIILVSIGIAFLFEKINRRVGNFKSLIINVNVWAEIRVHHVQVCELLKYVNVSMGTLLSLSCFIDGYFMLVQLLNITV